MDRRQFCNEHFAFSNCRMPGPAIASADGSRRGRQVSLRKVLRCIAGCHVGSALKGPCEGSTWQDASQIRRHRQVFTYRDTHNWNREPGTPKTEWSVKR